MQRNETSTRTVFVRYKEKTQDGLNIASQMKPQLECPSTYELHVINYKVTSVYSWMFLFSLFYTLQPTLVTVLVTVAKKFVANFGQLVCQQSHCETHCRKLRRYSVL